jgi:hypothetical protein
MVGKSWSGNITGHNLACPGEPAITGRGLRDRRRGGRQKKARTRRAFENVALETTLGEPSLEPSPTAVPGQVGQRYTLRDFCGTSWQMRPDFRVLRAGRPWNCPRRHECFGRCHRVAEHGGFHESFIAGVGSGRVLPGHRVRSFCASHAGHPCRHDRAMRRRQLQYRCAAALRGPQGRAVARRCWFDAGAASGGAGVAGQYTAGIQFARARFIDSWLARGHQPAEFTGTPLSGPEWYGTASSGIDAASSRAGQRRSA